MKSPEDAVYYRGHPKSLSSDKSGSEGQRCPSAPVVGEP